jgi:two-component system sensor histidine kinase/response regulator
MASTPATADATVLVVDDDDANRSLARHTLEDEGYRVVLASGGEEAIAAALREAPDCIVLDVRMPDVDGFSVCERIRSLPQAAGTPVLFLTASRDVETFDRALRAGGDDFLTKPIRPAELIVRVQSALKLRRLNAEAREHVDLLKHQRDDMVRLQLQKERLMAFVVHDLKNPVHALDLHAQVLLRDRTLTESARESAGQIRSAARQLNRMILNLLDLSKADEGKLTAKRTDVDLRALIDAVAGEMAPVARERDVTVHLAFETERARVDEDLLRRALANLVENAIRHAPRSTSVHVTATHGDGATELRVVDAGPGIAPALRESIFDAFVQLEGQGTPSSPTGRGLGLTFCRVAVEAHGGLVWIESADPGAIFVLRIPDAE